MDDSGSDIGGSTHATHAGGSPTGIDAATTLRALISGATVSLVGVRTDGRPYAERRLSNASIEMGRRSGDALIVGMEEGVGVRSFRIDGVRRMSVLTGSSEVLLACGDAVKASTWMELLSDDLRPLLGGAGGRR